MYRTQVYNVRKFRVFCFVMNELCKKKLCFVENSFFVNFTDFLIFFFLSFLTVSFKILKISKNKLKVPREQQELP